MLKLVLFFGAVLAYSRASTPLEGDSWALLVAGSNGWWNYRHQADVCHSYHVIMNEGIPQERIIVMMYDDIAYNDQNPEKGVIVNQSNGTNVYAGVKIDYKGNDVTANNFLSILSGDKEAMKHIGSGRVIESNKKQNVFVYFSDHGGPGILAFPNDYLYADHFIKTLNYMHEKKKYNQLILYIEACEAGSMFVDKLSEHHKAIAMTAAARDESSYGCYCGDSTWGTCLGDLFSVTWMRQMDEAKKGTKQTVIGQYQKVRSLVSKSHVELYGDFHVGFDYLTPNKDESSKLSSPEVSSHGAEELVDSREIPLFLAKAKISNSKDLSEEAKYEKEFQAMKKARSIGDEIMQRLVAVATGPTTKLFRKIIHEKLSIHLEHFPCYRELLSTFEKECFDAKNDYFLRHYYKFSNLCVLGVDTTKLLQEMGYVCKPLKRLFGVSEVL